MNSKKKITLYHFTSTYHLPMILKKGLAKGDVSTSPTEGFNAVWFTRDSSWSKQGWKEGSAVDKSAVRITVELPVSDKALYKWDEIAKKLGVSQRWYNGLEVVAGCKGSDWYIYYGVVPPTQFYDIEYKSLKGGHA